MATKVTQRQLDQKIKAADTKIEKYQGYITKLREEKKELNAQKRKLASEKTAAAKKTAASTTAAKKTTAKKTTAKKTTTKKTPAKKTTTKKSTKESGGLLETVLGGILDGAGLDSKEILDGFRGNK